MLTDGPVMGVPEKIAPADALLWCVAITAGEVRYLTTKVQELSEDELLGRPLTTTHEKGYTEKGSKDLRTATRAPSELHILVRERQRAVDRLSKYSKMAMDAGVAERQIQLAENQAGMLAGLLERVFGGISLTAKQRAALEPVLERELMLLETGDILGVAR